MRPMTAREALQIERDPYAAPDDSAQACRIMDALVMVHEMRVAIREQPSKDWAEEYARLLKLKKAEMNLRELETRRFENAFLDALERGEDEQCTR